MEEKVLRDLQYATVILSNISDAVLLTDLQGDFKFVCDNVTMIFKYTAAEVRAMQNIARIIGKETAGLGRYLNKEIRNLEVEAFDKFYHKHDLLINIKKLDCYGPSLLFTCRDITNMNQAANLNFKVVSSLRRISQQLLQLLDRIDRAGDSPKEVSREIGLTSREEYIVKLVCRGDSNKEIAVKAGISLSTVKKHLNRIFKKYSVYNRIQLLNKRKQEGSI